jgi:hypothetical protein
MNTGATTMNMAVGARATRISGPKSLVQFGSLSNFVQHIDIKDEDTFDSRKRG